MSLQQNKVMRDLQIFGGVEAGAGAGAFHIEGRERTKASRLECIYCLWSGTESNGTLVE